MMKNINTLFFSIVLITLSFVGYKEYIKQKKIKEHEQAILDELKSFYRKASHPNIKGLNQNENYFMGAYNLFFSYYDDTLQKPHFCREFKKYFDKLSLNKSQLYNSSFFNNIGDDYITAKSSNIFTHFPIDKLRKIDQAYSAINKLNQSFSSIEKLRILSLKLEEIDDLLMISHLSSIFLDVFSEYDGALEYALYKTKIAIEAIEGNDDWIEEAQAAYRIPIIYYYGKLPSENYFIPDSLAILYGFKMKYVDSVPAQMKGKNWKTLNNDADKTLALKWKFRGNWKEIFEEDTGKSLNIYFND